MESFKDMAARKAREIQAAKAAKQVNTPVGGTIKQVAAPEIVQPEPVKILANVEQVLNRNRLDIFFPEKPAAEVLQQLRDNGFWFRPSDKAWFNKDTAEVRAFVCGLLDLSPDSFADNAKAQNGTLRNSQPDYTVQADAVAYPTAVVPAPIIADDYEATEKAETEQADKVRRLCDALSVTPGQLMHKAVNCLYDLTFNCH